MQLRERTVFALHLTLSLISSLKSYLNKNLLNIIHTHLYIIICIASLPHFKTHRLDNYRLTLLTEDLLILFLKNGNMLVTVLNGKHEKKNLQNENILSKFSI